PRAGRDRRERDLRALHAHLQPRAGDEGHEVTPVQGAPRRYRLELRLWVMLSVAMALAATASTLAVLYLQRPFIAARGGLAPDAQNALFAAAVAAGGLAGLAGLALGVAWSRRIWAIVARTDAAVPSADGTPNPRVSDELGALDAAVGRLTLSMDRFISDSDILARLPAAMLLVDDARRLLVFNVTAEALLGPDLARFRGRPLLGVDGPLPVARGNEPLAGVMGEAERAGAACRSSTSPRREASGVRTSCAIRAVIPPSSASWSARLICSLMRRFSDASRSSSTEPPLGSRPGWLWIVTSRRRGVPDHVLACTSSTCSAAPARSASPITSASGSLPRATGSGPSTPSSGRPRKRARSGPSRVSAVTLNTRSRRAL